jgi:hypothetical protein
MANDRLPLWDAISRYLMEQHTTPHSSTGISPAEIMLKRKPRTRLDNLIPRTEDTVLRQQERMNRGVPIPQFSRNQRVFVREFPRQAQSPNYVGGAILEKTAEYTYRIQLDDGSVVYRHADHIKAAATASLRNDQQWSTVVRPANQGEGGRTTHSPNPQPTPEIGERQNLSTIQEQPTTSFSSFREQTLHEEKAREASRQLLQPSTSTPKRKDEVDLDKSPEQRRPLRQTTLGSGKPPITKQKPPTGTTSSSSGTMHPMQRRSQAPSADSSCESVKCVRVRQIRLGLLGEGFYPSALKKVYEGAVFQQSNSDSGDTVNEQTRENDDIPTVVNDASFTRTRRNIKVPDRFGVVSYK